ncbi:uncharacterized protein LOC143305529 [Osmia lignaria lignaria]|uniref:uncharacterized protein LOC143305529 n=1 Tax=Osmia lignaria lignaria TaxID=1437193 RepID=UPI00402BDF7F
MLLESAKQNPYPHKNLTPTVHKILCHGEYIIGFHILPIGELSEEAQEANHKEYRRLRLNDPLISSLRMQQKRKDIQEEWIPTRSSNNESSIWEYRDEMVTKNIDSISNDEEALNLELRHTGDKVWKFTFNKDKNKHIVFIATYKQENAQFEPKNEDKSMIIILKQAGLLTQETFSQLIKLACQNGYKLMTPLAGACFNKDDTSSLATELVIPEVDLLIKISRSTQSGGHYLKYSDVDIAVCASIAATRNVKDEILKKSIVVKILKQYINKGFIPNKARMTIISKYATGGIPSKFIYEEIVKVFDSEQTKYSALKIVQTTKQSEPL